MFWAKRPSSYLRPIIMLHPFRTTFLLLAVPSVPSGSPVGTSVLRMAYVGSVETFLCPMVFMFPAVLPIGSFIAPSPYRPYSSPHVCGRCQVLLLVFHILVDCPAYYVLRSRFFPTLTSVPPRDRLPFLLSESPTFSSSNTFHIF